MSRFVPIIYIMSTSDRWAYVGFMDPTCSDCGYDCRMTS